MKNKKIKLLKTLATVGSFVIVSTVPAIISACSSTADQYTGITPVIKSEVSLQGKLTGIYDTSTGSDRKDTNTLIAEDIKANLDKYFVNVDELKDVIQTSTITVDGGFSEKSTWEGENFETWSTDARGVTKAPYPSAAPKIDITSLNALKDEILKDDASIQKFLKDANLPFTSNASNFRLLNKPGLENGDLLHVNIKANRNRNNNSDLNLDLQIPVSNFNLKTTLKVSVSASNNVDGQNIGKDFNLTTHFNYSIGIDPAVNYKALKTALEVTPQESVDATEILKLSDYTDFSGNLDNDKIASAVGVFNSKFTPVSSVKVEGSQDMYNITLTAEPFSDLYFWDDGSTGSKTIQFQIKLNVKSQNAQG
ncbi:hypothetical protein D8X55_04860 [Malacoplasma penetrans]|uniref:P35 lipoprotein homolog n=1 Tax=Malacoplasma penetrans (strain HF-2) TaxID=272633 RepID=Q8EVA6_MALP2|nr:P35 family lipoprotein [Malacoplasma penetrans]RXY96061.1 hypothetical protein D8X55_04860 [Malacoplasma penetrans]BAC44451.1 P35 lipoprotein homolog [Malacoplasma penetrans HF-2]